MIRLYWKNATGRAVGSRHGVTKADLKRIEAAITAAHSAVMGQIAEGELGYAKLPDNGEYRVAVKDLVSRYRDNTTDMVVLGIGGSALGNIALQAALNPATYNLMSDRERRGPRLFILDNADPTLAAGTLKLLGRRLKTTLVNVISKSGQAAETAAQFMIFREALQKQLPRNFALRIVATTDPKKGPLHDIARKDGCAMLPVPSDVGGRFSVLSPVGLFSAAMCGIDIKNLLAGAAEMKARVERRDWRTNPACILAVVKYLMMTKRNKPIHVMMPYSNRLYPLADWYRQLWAESLGKKVDRAGRVVFAGATPVKALGATDQHSQIQLYREGPNDKFTVFLEVGKHPADIRIPSAFGRKPGLKHLRRKKLSKLLNDEKQATEYAMTFSQRPTVTIRFPEITPAAVGEFIYLYEFVTSLCGELLNINAYDQPAVELGKKATFALMGDKRYVQLARRIRSRMKVDKRYLI